MFSTLMKPGLFQPLSNSQFIGGNAPVSNGLLVDLVEYWPMNELSSNRTGVHDGHLLAASGSVGSNIGLVYANSAEWAAENVANYLSGASTDFNSAGTSFTVAAWVNEYSIPGTSPLYRIICETGPNTWAGGFDLFASGLGFASQLWHKDGSQLVLHALPNGSWLNNWHLGTLVYDSVADKGYLYCDAVMKQSGDDAIGAALTANTMYIGVLETAQFPWHGRIGPLMYWSRALSQTDIDTLYNAGAGLAYGNFTA